MRIVMAGNRAKNGLYRGLTPRSALRTGLSGELEGTLLGQTLISQDLSANVHALTHQSNDEMRHADVRMTQLPGGRRG